MTDLMPCQSCQSSAYFDYGDCGYDEVCCYNCGARGPNRSNGEHVYYLFKFDSDDGDKRRKELLAKLWNDMQATIARGLLIDSCEAKKTRSL